MTRQKQIIIWTTYSFVALLLLLVQTSILNRIFIGNIHPILLPFVVAMTAIYTPPKGSVILGFFFGFACDMLFAGPIPCFYLLIFMLCAFLSGLLSRRFIAPGPLCSILMCALSLFLTDLFILFFLSFQCEMPLLSGIKLFLFELFYSIPFSLLLHVLYTGIKRFLDRL